MPSSRSEATVKDPRRFDSPLPPMSVSSGTWAKAGGVAPTHELNLLAAGALEDAFGRTVDMDELKAIVIRNNIAGNLEVGGSAANSIGLFADDTDKLVLPTTAIIAVGLGATGIDVTTDSKLKFENKHTAAGTVDVLLVGAS